MQSSASYETPEEDLSESLKSLGKEVQLTTFKSNQQEEQDELCKPETRAIICVGASSFRDKIIYVRHYLGEKPKFSDSNCILGVETVTKNLVGSRSRDASTQDGTQRHKDGLNTPLSLEISVLGQHMPDLLAKLYIERMESKVGIIGSIIFCPASKTTLKSAVEWKHVVDEAMTSANKKIPCILLIENIKSIAWIGEGSFVEDNEAMELFCSEDGFDKWFEIDKSDWHLAENNVFGHAIDSVLQLRNSPKNA